jgi:hypothetical protein
LKQTSNEWHLIDLKDFVQDRQCEIEVNLEAGSYIIIPRTTGCLLQVPKSGDDKQEDYHDKENLTETLNSTKTFATPMFKSTIADIFRKFDMLSKQELGYQEFKAFCDCVEYSKEQKRPMSEDVFRDEILDKFASTKVKGNEDYNSTEGGLTL